VVGRGFDQRRHVDDAWVVTPRFPAPSSSSSRHDYQLGSRSSKTVTPRAAGRGQVSATCFAVRTRCASFPYGGRIDEHRRDRSELVSGGRDRHRQGAGAESVGHMNSEIRARAPFVVFDCSAIAPTLIESELFGHRARCFHRAAGARRPLRAGQRPARFHRRDRRAAARFAAQVAARAREMSRCAGWAGPRRSR